MRLTADARGVDATELALVEEHLVSLGFEVSDPGPEWGRPSRYDLVAHPKSDPSTVVGVCQGAVTEPPFDEEPSREADATVLALRRVTPRQGERLRAAGQSYVDASGNAWIDAPGVTVFVAGRPVDPRTRGLPDPEGGWALRPSGLQVLFALLTLPELMPARLVDVAEAAGVSTTTTHHVMRDMASRGWVDGSGSDRSWADRAAAGRTWLNAHIASPPPARSYVTAEPVTPRAWVDLFEREEGHGWVTGAAALEVLGHDLNTGDTALYSSLPFTPPGHVRIARPRGGQAPTLVVREAWWPSHQYPGGTTPLLLSCADALAEGEPRAASLAREVMRDDPDLRPLLTA